MFRLVAGETEGFEGVHPIIAANAALQPVMDLQTIGRPAAHTLPAVTLEDIAAPLFIGVAAANLAAIGE